MQIEVPALHSKGLHVTAPSMQPLKKVLALQCLRLILPQPLESKCWGWLPSGVILRLALAAIPRKRTTTKFMALGITTSLQFKEALHITVTPETPPTTSSYWVPGK